MKKTNHDHCRHPGCPVRQPEPQGDLYVHGKNGCKEEAERFAGTACAAGWQVLAIDLPGAWRTEKNSPERLLPGWLCRR